MGYSNSPMVAKIQLSSKYNKKTGPNRKITIHHAAGCMSMENLLNYVATTSRDMSTNYVVSGGKVGMSVEEKNRAWTSSSPSNDYQAITIEVANSSTGGVWPISDLDLETTIKLCADICKRNGIPKLYYDGTPNGTLTYHKMFDATPCPGPYITSKVNYICDRVNALINGGAVATPTAPTTSEPTGNKYVVNTVLFGYICAANAVTDTNRRCTVKPGTYYVYNATSDAINVTMNPNAPGAWVAKKMNVATPAASTSITEVANDVIRGEWGNGSDRINRLKAAGYDPSAVQDAVNSILNGNTPAAPAKSVEAIAKEVIQGKWGNGVDRKQRLAAAGYNYDQVQAAVNKLV